MPIKSIGFIILWATFILALFPVNPNLSGFIVLLGLLVLLRHTASKVGPMRSFIKNEKIEVEIVYGKETYKIILTVIVYGDIGTFTDLLRSKEFWHGVLKFPMNASHSTMQEVQDLSWDCSVKALEALNQSISLRYIGECELKAISVQYLQVTMRSVR